MSAEFEAVMLDAVAKEFNRRFCFGPGSDIRSHRQMYNSDNVSYPPNTFVFRIYHNVYFLCVKLRFLDDMIYGMISICDVAREVPYSLCGMAAHLDGYMDLKDPDMDVDGILNCLMPVIDTFKTNADQHARWLKERLPFSSIDRPDPYGKPSNIMQ